MRKGFFAILGGLLATAVLAGLAWWWWSRPAVPTSRPPRPGLPQAYPRDPADAARNLVEALHARLEEMDLLKLLDEPVETMSDESPGSKVRTYRETYRLPNRMSADFLARDLSKAAGKSHAALLTSRWREDSPLGRDYECRFGFPGGWAPVTLVFREVKAPRVALVIDDAGYVAGRTLEEFWRLKVPATVAVIPGLEFSTKVAREAPSHGWEVICHMPMEGHEAVADGVYGWFLKKDTHPGYVTSTLSAALEELPNCRGMNNHMGSRATEDKDLMLQVGHFLHSRGLYFLDSRTSVNTVALETVRQSGADAIERNVFLDNEGDPAYINRQLAQAVARARRKGSVVAIGHFRLATLKALGDAMPVWKEKGVKFVYLSELVK